QFASNTLGVGCDVPDTPLLQSLSLALQASSLPEGAFVSWPLHKGAFAELCCAIVKSNCNTMVQFVGASYCIVGKSGV
ncbi:MAG: hypothetical protein IKD26_04370, partial [Clostridia bacterium]|nr:hypothetical protein [Clostridia bacterium]